MDIKPNVFQTQSKPVVTEQAKIEAYEAEKKAVTNEIYANSMNETQFSAIEQMRKRTEEQMKLRDEQIKKSQELTNNFQQQTEFASTRNTEPYTPAPQNVPVNNNYVPPVVPPTPPVKPPVFEGQNYGQNPSGINPYIQELSQPQFNTAYDVLPLPSEGKLYPSKRANVKVAYMTTGDENILTSPNLLQSGEFLEILINRKLLESGIRYRDLHVGDRNAIMLWLRATGYGEMYPVTLLDENDIPFETEINLNNLKTKKLGAEPDAEGLFGFTLPVSKTPIKFRLLTVGDVDDIERMVEFDKSNKVPVNNTSTYSLERTLVEVNGNRDKSFIIDYASNLRIGDAKALREYIDKIESGVELEITVGTPGGGSIKTFLPLNIKFFWPNF